MSKTNLAETLQNYEITCKTLGISMRKKWNKEYLFARRMKSNSTKISFISKSKLEGLKENVKDFVLNDLCEQQRAKYFKAVKPARFIEGLIDTDLTSIASESAIEVIKTTFNRQFLETISSKFTVYEGNDICSAYNEANAIVGCMGGGKPSEWFKVYADTKDLKLVALTDDNGCILIRALLWEQKGKYFLDNTYEQGAINGDVKLRKHYQYKLYAAVLKHLNKRKLDCKFLGYIDAYLTPSQKAAASEPDREINPILEGDKEYDYFPYSDTFRSICKLDNSWCRAKNEGNTDYILLEGQSGEDMNNNLTTCFCCDGQFSAEDDEIVWSNFHEEYMCTDCCIYCEDREEYIMSDDTSYDSWRNVYVYSGDIE